VPNSLPRTAANVRGAALGALILTAFGTAWAVLALTSLPAPPHLPIALVAAVAAVLMGLAVRRVLTAGSLPSPEDEEAAQQGRRAGVAFGIIFTLEGATIGVGAVLLARADQSAWIPPFAAIVVGLHFLPLARVFRVPLYTCTGTAAVVWTLLCMAALQPWLRLLALGLGMGAILFTTAAVVLYRVR
jgi:hypothetical protein